MDSAGNKICHQNTNALQRRWIATKNRTLRESVPQQNGQYKSTTSKQHTAKRKKAHRKKCSPEKSSPEDVNKNEINFLGKNWANIKYNGETTKLPILITQRNDVTPLLGVNWLKQLPITITKISLDDHTNQSNNNHTKFHKLFVTNHKLFAGLKIQIKP